MPRSKPLASADPQPIEALHFRILEVATIIGAIHPSTFEIAERLKDLSAAPDPWRALDERRALTSAAARLAATNSALLGLLGENDLVLADRDDLAAGLADRGLMLPRKRSVFKRKAR